MVDRVLADWITRACALELRVCRSEERTRADLAAALRVHVARYVRQGHDRIPV